ncbi:NAD(P)/FAD-dependent oxidoreductase [Paraburkholderia aromaticivorans]|uniref:FAD/NAD(P)-binding oxidoreductase n=1 Tax=Paraburkholderia aromaticivorans TaxID=2026199 RepID=A0A248VRJ5_9BURK|nr:NAD(P)/FAD-dependent oxidoreductase [Paraburkholderia aromaticivorans]ASW01621.1 FAD/NAD(P)-binding oxidoreductase [Paraburkholderia aromaticivorans]
MSELQCDLLIVGAGPAGMAAAIEARARGLTVIVADEGKQAGGQIYRQAAHSPLAHADQVLGADYAAGRPLIARFMASGAQYFAQTLVWQIEPGAPLSAMLTCRGEAGGTLRVRAQALLLATGAQERAWPVRGWTLPGVMGVGAAQTMLKAGGLVPGANTVLAGSGPLLWLYASQLLQAGRTLRAIVDTTPRGALRGALRHLPRAWRAGEYLFKGLRMMRAVRRSGIELYRAARDVEVLGEAQPHLPAKARAIRFRAGGHQYEIPADLILLHQGVVPGGNAARSIGCAHRWDDAQACWQPQVDSWGRSSVARVWIAGDGAGIGGAKAAEHAGELAALDIAADLGHIDPPTRASASRAARAELDHHLTIRPFLDALYTPPPSLRRPAEDVVVCRCEEVSAGEIRRLARLDCAGPNQLKAFSRCGMGPCQGRWCGTTVGELLAEVQGRQPREVGYYRIRAPIKPVTIDELATVLPTDRDFVRGEFPS